MRSGAIVGSCEDMCPEVERERRSRLSDIQVCSCGVGIQAAVAMKVCL